MPSLKPSGACSPKLQREKAMLDAVLSAEKCDCVKTVRLEAEGFPGFSADRLCVALLRAEIDSASSVYTWVFEFAQNKQDFVKDIILRVGFADHAMANWDTLKPEVNRDLLKPDLRAYIEPDVDAHAVVLRGYPLAAFGGKRRVVFCLPLQRSETELYSQQNVVLHVKCGSTNVDFVGAGGETVRNCNLVSLFQALDKENTPPPAEPRRADSSERFASAGRPERPFTPEQEASASSSGAPFLDSELQATVQTAIASHRGPLFKLAGKGSGASSALAPGAYCDDDLQTGVPAMPANVVSCVELAAVLEAINRERGEKETALATAVEAKAVAETRAATTNVELAAARVELEAARNEIEAARAAAAAAQEDARKASADADAKRREALDKGRRASNDLRSKDLQLKAVETREKEAKVAADAAIEATRVAEEGMKDAEARAMAAEEGMKDAEARATAAEAGMKDAEARAAAAEAGMKDAEARAAAAEAGLKDTEARAAAAEAGMKDAEARATAGEAMAKEASDAPAVTVEVARQAAEGREVAVTRTTRLKATWGSCALLALAFLACAILWLHVSGPTKHAQDPEAQGLRADVARLSSELVNATGELGYALGLNAKLATQRDNLLCDIALCAAKTCGLQDLAAHSAAQIKDLELALLLKDRGTTALEATLAALQSSSGATVASLRAHIEDLQATLLARDETIANLKAATTRPNEDTSLGRRLQKATAFARDVVQAFIG
eukprot:tig00000144_g9032.t1